MAVDELIELGGAIDGLLSQQADLDLGSLEKAIGRTLSEPEKAEIKRNTHRAYRWTFLVSGLTPLLRRGGADQPGPQSSSRGPVASTKPDPAISAEDDRLPRVNTRLVEEIRDVVADSLLADSEALPCGVAEYPRDQHSTSRSRAVRRRGGSLRAEPKDHEIGTTYPKARPCRLGLEGCVAACPTRRICAPGIPAAIPGLRNRQTVVAWSERRARAVIARGGGKSMRTSLEQPSRRITAAGRRQAGNQRICASLALNEARREIWRNNDSLAPATHQLDNRAVLTLALRSARCAHPRVSAVGNHP